MKPLLFASAVLLLAISVRTAEAQHDHVHLPDLDRRLQQPANAEPVTGTIAAARGNAEVVLRNRLPHLQLERHAVTRSPKWISTRDGFLTGKHGVGRGTSTNRVATTVGVLADDPKQVTKAFVTEHTALFGHDATTLERAAVKRDYVTGHNGMRTTIWQQEHQGIEVFSAVFVAHTTKDGELVNIASQFVRDEAQAAANGDLLFAAAGVIAPAISAAEALVLAATDLGAEDAQMANVDPIDEPAGADQRQKLRSPAVKGEALVRLIWLPMGENELRLCWRVLLKTQESVARYRVLVDAETGEVWVRHNMTTDLSNASYRVFTGDSPTPFSPGYSSPGNTNQPAEVARQLVTLSALNTTASPNGWIDDGVNETRGNNIDAHTDIDADDVPDLPRPQGSPNRVFDFPLDLTKAPSTYRPAAVVNLFYWCNWMHDKLWELGFTEAAGNFQNNNFGRGGVGGDAVRAQAQDGDGANNANFSYTDADGEVCDLQMFLWTGPNPDRDGDFEMEVILHEYAHGLSQRLVGGGVGIDEFQSKSLGEGWSDFFGLALLSQPGDNHDGVFARGAYSRYLISPGFMENYYYGARFFPYSTDMSVNPLTFNDIDSAQRDLPSDVPHHPSQSAYGGIHDYGTMWAVTLWDARVNLIKKHGFATGNQLILQLVVDGMKLTPPNPNFVQARDAILQADQVANGGANLKELWKAFAKRGLGRDATSPASSTTLGVVESFDSLDDLRVITPINLSITGPVGGPFDTAPRVFTLKNEGAASLNWSVLVEPPIEANPTSGTLGAGMTRDVSISLDANAAAFFPEGEHAFSITFSNHVSHETSQRIFRLKVLSDAEPVVEVFDYSHPFDLDFRSLTFTPEGTNSYHVCRDVVASFPSPTLLATTVNIPQDGYVKVNLSGGQRVRLFGKTYSSVYITEEGAITMTPPPADADFKLADHFAQPRVSGMFRDMMSNATSRVSWQQLPDRFVATWEKAKLNGTSLTNNFQIEMFTNGVIRICLLKVEGNDGLVGLSAGGGIPLGLQQADFSSLTDCDITPLKLTLPSVVTEGINLRAGAGTVSIPTGRSVPTIVNLASSDTTELIVPSSVVIPLHATSATFDVTVVNDLVRDGSQLAYVTATALNYVPALARVRVDDNENNPLTVSVPLFASESQGDFKGIITVPNPASGVVTVFLSSSRTNEIEVPPVAFIPAGQTSTVFTATVIDDHRIDGNLGTTITATVPNWTSGSDTINIFDNEDRLLRLKLPLFITEGAGILTNAGEVYLSGTLETDLNISLGSSNFFAMFPLGPVTIPAGQTNAHFNLAIGDNADIDGLRFIANYATAPGFSNAVASVLLLDNDYPPDPSNPYPPDDSVDWPLHTHLEWDTVEGELVINGGFETGDFTGWTVDGFGGGGFVLNDGSFDPDSPDGALPPIAGSFGALAIQNGNGKHTLAQEFSLPVGATSTTLKWTHDIRNHAGVFASDHRFAVELRRAGDDTLLATLFSTQPGDAAFGGPTNRTASLQAWRGERVRLVFVEEDSLGHLNVHLDNISLVAGSAEPTTFDVYFGNDTTPDETDYVGSTTNAYWDLLPLAGGLNYYWRIDSRRLGITNAGPVWNFRTSGSSLASAPLTFGSAWKYVASGANLGTTWRSTRYDDSLWPSGTAPLGFGSSQTTTIGVASNDFTTFYFRRRLAVADTNRLATVTASLRRDDGAVVYVNGIEAFRDNMPTGTVTYVTQAASISSGADETNSHLHSIDPSLFIEGTNIIAVEVHQRDNGFPFFGPSPDLFFDLALTFRTNTANMAPWAINWIAPGDFDMARTPTNLLLRASVNDDNLIGTGVEIFANGLKIGADTVSPFNITWTNPPAGLHTLLAVATDSGGLSVTSPPLHVLIAPAVGQSFLTLVPAGAVWRYRDNGEDPGLGWNTLSYREPRDHSWAGGPAQLGYGDGDEATTFSLELDRFDKPITSYLRHTFNSTIAASELRLRVLRDDGVAVYLNGTEVFRNNLPRGTLASNTLALTAITGAAENTWLTASLSPALLDSGANIVAAELHQSSSSTPDASFDLELTALGNVLPTVAMTSPAVDNTLLSPPSVQLAATASDAYGSVTNVQFFRNGTPLSSDASAPYQFLWNNPPPGVHTLTAVATDNLGATRASTPVTLTIVPVVTLSARSLATNLLELAWPTSAVGYQVETAPSLLDPIFWTPINVPAEEINGQFRILISPDETEHYFRLRAP